MTDPQQIARLITEDEQYNRCPACGDEFATVVGDEVACPNEKCKHYNKSYEMLVPIEIGNYVNEKHDMSWGDWMDILEIAAETGNVRGFLINDEPFIITWTGPHNVSDQQLMKKYYDELDDPDMENEHWERWR